LPHLDATLGKFTMVTLHATGVKKDAEVTVKQKTTANYEWEGLARTDSNTQGRFQVHLKCTKSARVAGRVPYSDDIIDVSVTIENPDNTTGTGDVTVDISP
jgi:hypothetical protein